MATLTKDEILDAIGAMSVLELSELLTEFEDKFGVTAAAPMAAAAAAPASDGGDAEEEKTHFDVVITGIGEKKIAVIKAVRELTSAGLKEAKAMVEEPNKVVLEGHPKADAEKAKEKLEEAGATAELR